MFMSQSHETDARETFNTQHSTLNIQSSPPTREQHHHGSCTTLGCFSSRSILHAARPIHTRVHRLLCVYFPATHSGEELRRLSRTLHVAAHENRKHDFGNTASRRLKVGCARWQRLLRKGIDELSCLCRKCP